MRIFFTLMLLATCASAETFHVWRGVPVAVGGARFGAWTPLRAEIDSFVAELRAAGHEVVLHNSAAEETPPLTALPAVTVLVDGRYVEVIGAREATELTLKAVSPERVDAALASDAAARASALRSEASELRILAGKAGVLAAELGKRGSAAEAESVAADGVALDAAATLKDAEAEAATKP